MRRVEETGVWEIVVAGIGHGERYQYEIVGADGASVRKADPVGFAMDLRPDTASRVWDMSAYRWNDGEWMAARAARDHTREPVSIYEVHLGSWRRGPDSRWLT